MGGRLALYLAVRRSHLIDNVLLESASPGLATRDKRDTRVKQDEALAERILNDGIETFVNRWEKIPLFETQTTLPEPVKNRIRSERLSQKPTGLSNSLKGMSRSFNHDFMAIRKLFFHKVSQVDELLIKASHNKSDLFLTFG